MRKNIRVSEPSAEMQMKIQRARHAISSQKMRMVKCPYGDGQGSDYGFSLQHEGQQARNRRIHGGI